MKEHHSSKSFSKHPIHSPKTITYNLIRLVLVICIYLIKKEVEFVGNLAWIWQIERELFIPFWNFWTVEPTIIVVDMPAPEGIAHSTWLKPVTYLSYCNWQLFDGAENALFKKCWQPNWQPQYIYYFFILKCNRYVCE